VTELPPFVNESILELRRASVRAGLGEAMRALERKLPLAVPVMVGRDSRAGEELVSSDPGAPDRVIACAPLGTAADVGAAVGQAREGFAAWSAKPAAERAGALLGAAQWMRERRLELAALEVRECAKPWPEADADVCEAIDFLEYYARGAIELERGPELVQVPGERNELRYYPRGVAGVIAPWNFPIAIPCGMTAGALATGNTVVLKPAEQSPGCALMIVAALRAGGHVDLGAAAVDGRHLDRAAERGRTGERRPRPRRRGSAPGRRDLRELVSAAEIGIYQAGFGAPNSVMQDGVGNAFLGREPGRKMARRKFHRLAISSFALGEDAFHEPFAEPIERMLNALDLDHIYANADNAHGEFPNGARPTTIHDLNAGFQSGRGLPQSKTLRASRSSQTGASFGSAPLPWRFRGL